MPEFHYSEVDAAAADRLYMNMGWGVEEGEEREKRSERTADYELWRPLMGYSFEYSPVVVGLLDDELLARES